MKINYIPGVAHPIFSITGSEIDIIEEAGGKLTGHEIKWGNARARSTLTCQETYQAGVELINRENYLDFLGV